MMRINFDTLRRAWKQPFSRKVALAAGVVVVGSAGLATVESLSSPVPLPDKAGCCTSAVATGDAMMSPAIGADKDFFEVPSTPASVFFLLGNNESMQDFPDGQWLPEAATPNWYTTPATPKPGDPGYKGDKGYFMNTGCTDPALVSAMSWFDKTKGGSVYDGDSELKSLFFNPAEFYHVRGRRLAWQKNNLPYSMLTPDFFQLKSVSAIETACLEVWNRDSDYYKKPIHNECVQCLTSVGWWRGPIADGSNDGLQGPSQSKDEPTLPPEARRKWVVTGRILNLRPPKFVVARKVLKEVISTAANVRMGVATFGPDRGWFDPPTILKDMSPACDKSFPVVSEADLNRPGIVKSVNNARFDNKERSIGEALFGLGGYFSSQTKLDTWKKWFDQPIGNNTWGWPGLPKGATYDNTFGINQTGGGYAKGDDEWLKKDYKDPVTGIVYPGMRWEIAENGMKSVCFGCQVSSVIVLTDGAPKYDNSVPITKMMSLLMSWKAKHITDQSPVTFTALDPRTTDNNTDTGGINYCDKFKKNDGTQATKWDCDYTDFNWPTGQFKGNKNFMDDVSYFLGQADLREDYEGTQSMRTYTVGYGDNSPMLQSIALAGKGKFYRADDEKDLKKALLDVLGDIKQQSTSFASANISGVQTGGMQSSTFVPRFVPRRARPYEGHLYRFFYFNEFAQGCQPLAAGATEKDKYDLNKDGDCDDTFFLDQPAGYSASSGVPDITSFNQSNIVQENSDGTWVKVFSSTASRDEKGALVGGDPAKPFWDLSETLESRDAGKNCREVTVDPSSPQSTKERNVGGRCIFTMWDRDNDGKFTAADNPPVEFNEDNIGILKKYLLASGDSFCNTLLSRAGKSGAVDKQDECARVLVRFVRGLDVFDYDTDGDFDEGRPCADTFDAPGADKLVKGATESAEAFQRRKGQKTCKLADIFHSTPVTVEPPVDPFMCSLGLSSQCVSTLYDDFSYAVSSEPLCSAGGSKKPCYKPTPLATPRSQTLRNGVYDEYLTDPVLSTRDRIALVGSNGGMLHAIHVGSANQAKTGKLGSIYDNGTGQEVWAFIPPDLLPKLNLMTAGHEYFVDGTPMVRDVWVDGAPGGTSGSPGRDGIKQKDEFRTLAVIGERSGGQRYSALDVTDPEMMITAVKNPSKSLKPFRWMFPNACDNESLTMGQSWSNFAPKPPPIGAVRLKAAAGASPSDLDRGWEERWVTVLNGGYSPDLTRGRGVYMVDAWTGDKLWSAEAQSDGATAGYAGLLNNMKPVASAAALVDLGKGEGLQRDLDGFFDTLVVGDMGGQVWTFRLKNPGEQDNLGIVRNWFGARSLEMQREEGSTNGHQKAPFFQVAATVLQPDTGWLRAYMGTGDRQHLRTTPGADCSSDDLLGCIRLKCDVKASFVGEVNGKKLTSVLEYTGGVLTSDSSNWQAVSGGEACSSSRMELTELSYNCPANAYGKNTYTSAAFTTLSSCKKVNGDWECDRQPLNTFDHHDQALTDEEKGLVATNTFFGFHAYGGTKRIFEDAAGALAFDKLRLTDKPNVTCEGLKCSLVDVTIPESAYQKLAKVNGVEQRYLPLSALASLKRAGSEDPGWFIRYNNTKAERTATGSTVLAGIVFWSSFSPSTTAGVSACSLAGMNDRSFSWQADAITGLPDQASGFKLAGGYIASRETPTAAPPGDPSPVIAMSTTGGIRYQVALSSAGAAPTTETLSTRKNTTPDISWLEVPRNLHECRHSNSDSCTEESSVAAPTP